MLDIMEFQRITHGHGFHGQYIHCPLSDDLIICTECFIGASA